VNSLEGVKVVGLTGQTGSGKSTVSKIFSENGFAVIDADKIARLIVHSGSKCLEEIAECFNGVILENGELDRQKLADIVFGDAHKLEVLNSITYPYITGEILKQIRQFSDNGNKLILLDAPTLFESRADDFCEIIISVVSHDDLRQQRIMKRDGLTEEQAVKRMNAQLDKQFYMEHSDFVIKNNKDISHVLAVAAEVVGKVKCYFNK